MIPLMKLPLIAEQDKRLFIVSGYIAFSGVYLLSGHHYLGSPRELTPGWIDQLVPFYDWSIWVYLSQFGFLFTALWWAPTHKIRSVMYFSMIMATLIAALCFMIFPTTLPLQPIQSDGITSKLWKGLYVSDVPTNCIPSLHTALACLAGKGMMSKGGYWLYGAPLWALLIIISTMTTKQHYSIDVLLGIFLAVLSWQVVSKVVTFA